MTDRTLKHQNVMARALYGQLISRDIEVESKLHKFGLSREKFLDRSDRVPLKLTDELIALARKVTGNYWAPFEWTQSVPIASFRGFGLIFELSGTLGRALKSLSELTAYLNEATKLKVDRVGNLYELSFEWHPSMDPSDRATFSELWVYHLVRRSWEIMHSRWVPEVVHFNHQPKAPLDEYEKYFCCPLKFGQPSTKILIHPRDWEAPTLGHQPHLAKLIEDLVIKNMESSSGGGLAERYQLQTAVAQIIRRKLERGHVGIGEVARDLGYSVRALQRGLKEQKTSFRKILSQVRLQLGADYLKARDIPLAEVAFILGYSSQSSFTRAFQKTVQSSPQSFRKSHSSSQASAGTGTGAGTETEGRSESAILDRFPRILNSPIKTTCR